MAKIPKRHLSGARRTGLKMMGRRRAGSFRALGLLIFVAATFLYYWLPEAERGPSDKAVNAGLPGQFSGRVQKVHDGDTITVKTEDRRSVKIRLYGIDAPEQAQAYGPESGRYLMKMLADKEVRVETQDLDQYGRVVGLVFLGGQSESVNQDMVKNGQAWVYKHFCKIHLCRQLKKDEAAARQNSRGLWARPDPAPPWEWRYLNKN